MKTFLHQQAVPELLLHATLLFWHQISPAEVAFFLALACSSLQDLRYWNRFWELCFCSCRGGFGWFVAFRRFGQMRTTVKMKVAINAWKFTFLEYSKLHQVHLERPRKNSTSTLKLEFKPKGLTEMVFRALCYVIKGQIHIADRLWV